MFKVTRKAVIKGIVYKKGDSIEVENGLKDRLLNMNLIEKTEKEVFTSLTINKDNKDNKNNKIKKDK